MARARARAVILAGMVLACCACAAALDPSLDISQYAHTAWKIRDGFVKGAIYSIVQTPDGYLWLGTDFGLVRFDGVRAVPWQPPAGQQLPGNIIAGLLAGRDGTLWIGTMKGLASWKDGKLTQYPELAGAVIFALLEDRSGKVWAGTIERANGRLCRVQGGKAECYGMGSFGRGVVALYEDARGNLWASSPAGLWRWAPGPPQRYAFPRGVVEANSLIEDETGALLLATSDGLEQLKDGKIQSYALSWTPGQFRPHRFFRSSDGSLWIGANQGLMRLHQGRIDWFAVADGLSGDDIGAIFEDREHNVWVGTTGGLDRFREYAVRTMSVGEGLSNSEAISVQATPDGSVWIAMANGLNRWKNGATIVYRGGGPGGHNENSRETSIRRHATEITDSGLMRPANSLGMDDGGRLWAATSEGVYYFEGGRFHRVVGVPGGYVPLMTGDGRGNVWVLNGKVGLFHVARDGAVQKVAWPRPVPAGTYWAVLLPDGSQSGLWFGFYEGGVAYVKDGQIRASYSAADGLGGGTVSHLRLGSHGALWAATDGGLSRIQNGHVATLTSKNGLPCDQVNWSMEDDDHAVWLYMPCGLVRVEGAELDKWVSDPKSIVKVTTFGTSDGVLTRSLTGAYLSRVTRSPDGRQWFATWDGVSVFDPRHLAFNKLPPPVHIEKIIADGKSYGPADGEKLPALVRNLTIDYTALSLAVPEKVRFRFKLEGQDRDWREVVNDRQVQYSNLPPNHYRFRVIASNNSGVWNEEGATLDFVIPPAWYQTAWFRLSCMAALLALLYAFHRLRMHQQAQQFNIRLEERVGERTRIARDLHDTMLQSFLGVMLKLHTIPYIPNLPAEARKRLEGILEQGHEAINEGRDAVQGMRSSTFIKNDLACALATVGETLAAEQNSQSPVDFRVVVEGESRDLHPILRDEAYRIAREATCNAFRHSGARRIGIEISYEKKQLRVRVHDNGKGIDAHVLDGGGREGHFGLPGMHERAKLAGGKLTVRSRLDSGTEVELTIPGSLAYAKLSALRRAIS